VSLLLTLDDYDTEENSKISIRESKYMESISQILGPFEIFFTLFKGMVGIGFLYLPIGYSHAGWAFSVVAFLICSVLSSEGFNRLISSHERVGGTYSELARKAGGKPLKIVVELFLVLSQV
jgi:amino acid permease